MNAPVIIVAGLGRCGSSLTMQMLDAGGVPCVGRYPAFEANGMLAQDAAVRGLALYAGRAMKALDPHAMPIPAGVDMAVIWLDRALPEQARSQYKMATLATPAAPLQRRQLRAWTRGLQQDRAASLRRLRGNPLLRLDFERLIEAPHDAAHQIAVFLAPWFPHLDAAAMAAQVRPRVSAACAPGMAMELALIAARDAA